MFASSQSSGLASILYSVGDKPLEMWDAQVLGGHIRRIVDKDVDSPTIELFSPDSAATFITSPAHAGQSLGISYPFLSMLIKNTDSHFAFEVEVLDNLGIKRRFRASTAAKAVRVRPFLCSMPMRLDSGWNQVSFDLSDFTRRAYGTEYLEAVRITIHASCRLRRVFFADRAYGEDELPEEYKVFIPLLPPVQAEVESR